jgi:hypothetical protein
VYPADEAEVSLLSSNPDVLGRDWRADGAVGCMTAELVAVDGSSVTVSGAMSIGPDIPYVQVNFPVGADARRALGEHEIHEVRWCGLQIILRPGARRALLAVLGVGPPTLLDFASIPATSATVVDER